MKKYVDGQYVEMTAEEVDAWEQAQQENVEDSNESSGGGRYSK